MATASPPKPDLDAAHRLRLAQLLESGRLTPAPSPTPEQSKDEGSGPSRKAGGGRKRHAQLDLEAVAEAEPHTLPDAIQYIVAVSTRSADVGLENDHNLHCLCSFPTHQAAYDFIQTNRLSLARHYLRDDKLNQQELEQNTKGMDEFYLGENTSLEILQVPHFDSLARAPAPGALLYSDHFASCRQGPGGDPEALYERQISGEGQGGGAGVEDEGEGGEGTKEEKAGNEGEDKDASATTQATSGKKSPRSAKSKRRKVA